MSTTNEQKAAWDEFHGLSNHEWLMHKCSDCDPEFAEPDDPEDDANRYDEAARIICVKGERPDYCPRCGAYLSLDDGLPVFVSRYNFRDAVGG